MVLANVPSFRFSFRGNIRRNHPFGNHPFGNHPFRFTQKGHWEIKGRFRKRVVLANVPSFRFSFRGNIRQNHPFGNHPFGFPRTRVYPYPLGAGSARPNPTMGAPDPANPLFLGFSVSGGGLRPWSQTMVSEGARPWGRGRSGDCEFLVPVRCLGHPAIGKRRTRYPPFFDFTSITLIFQN